MTRIKPFLTEVLRLILYSLYPLYILYLNFIYLGLFTLNPKVFGTGGVITFFVIFNIFQTFTIIYYILIFTTDGKSTQDIFPMAIEQKLHRSFTNINPFIAESLQKKTIEKTHICSICQTYKPPRSHHCSRCDKCFLKMSHHCIFLDVCIGFHNYKFFIQFLVANILFITFGSTIIAIDTSFKRPLRSETLANFIVVMSLSAITLFLSVISLIYHIRLISNNETLIESAAIDSYLEGDHSHIEVFQEGPILEFSDSRDRSILNPYNLGKKTNWKEVFGDRWIDWILPSFTTKGDGISFEKNYEEDGFIESFKQ